MKRLKIPDNLSYLGASVTARGLLSLLTIPLENKRILLSLKSPESRLGFKGIRATIARDMSFTALYWPICESLRAHFSPSSDYRHADKDKGQLFWTNLFSASIAGAVSAIATSPLDLIKTRIQAGLSESSGIMSALRQVLREKGVRGLYRGAEVRLVKSVVHCSTMLVFFEEFNKVFKDRGF